MFNLSSGELLIIAVLVLILFGPDRLPELSRTFGRVLREWRDSTQEIKQSIQQGFHSPSADAADEKVEDKQPDHPHV